MLLDKYLPKYDFSSNHAIEIAASAEKIYSIINDFDFSDSRVIRILMALRGMGQSMASKTGLVQGNFIELEKIENKELAMGLVGQFWKPGGNLQNLSAAQFTLF
jgi:hypothetical protein